MEEVVTYSAGDLSTAPDLRLLHFNDGMYSVNSWHVEPVAELDNTDS